MNKPKLLLLHGAVGSKDQLQSLAALLSADFEVHSLNFMGHGNTASDKEFSIENFAEEVKQYIESNGKGRMNIFGYSMGGYVALYVAKQYPHLVDRIITLGTKMFWSPAIAAKEQQMLDADTLLQKAPAFVAALEKTHSSNDWRLVLNNTQKLMHNLGETNLLLSSGVSTIEHAVLLMLGDRDRMVSLEETANVFKDLPNAQLAVLPGTPHMIEKLNAEIAAVHIQQHLTEDK